ncbi:Zn-ribbon domain-containing OB-fold protein [Bradyrhizobium cenepequi]
MVIRKYSTARRYPPRLTHFNQPFWSGLQSGEFKTTRCTKCSEATFPPKPICPRCWCTDMDWVDISPDGEVYSYTVIHAAPAIFAEEAPYVVAIVDLDQGLRLASRVLDKPDHMAVGLRGSIVATHHPDGPYFAFEIKK